MRLSHDHRRPGVRHRRQRLDGAEDRGFDAHERAHRQRHHDDGGRQIWRLLAGGGIGPQERHRCVRRARPSSSQSDRRIHRDRLGRSPQLLRLPGPRLYNRRCYGLDAGDRLPRRHPPEGSGALAGTADRGRPLPPRYHGEGRPRLPRLLERRADHPRRGQRNQGREPGESAVRVAIQVRPKRHVRARGAALGPGVRAGHPYRLARRGIRVRRGRVYAARPYKGLMDGNNLTFGRMHVIDVSDITHPTEVAWYEPTDGGVHNVWVVGDTLYLGNYQGGARVLDVSGELKGDLLRQGREISWILTADSTGHRPHTPFAWGAVVRDA